MKRLQHIVGVQRSVLLRWGNLAHSSASSASKLLLAGLVSVMLVGCTALTNVGGGSAVPMNPGVRLDMIIDEPDYRSAPLVPIVRSTWSGSHEMGSWFVLVDRMNDPQTTVILDIDFRGVARNSERIGTPKYGYTTLFTTRAEVVFTLIDVRSGVVLASATGVSTASGSSGGAQLDHQAVVRAVDIGLRRLLRVYAGEDA